MWILIPTRTVVVKIINSALLCTCFAAFITMFLTNPTIDELQALDVSTLKDMLAYQTTLHIQFLKEEGLTSATKSCLECMNNIQAAIEKKRQLEEPDISMVTSNS